VKTLDDRARASRQRLIAKLIVLAVAVGAAVAAVSAYAGVAACRGAEAEVPRLSGGGDQVCFDLVRTLAEREGMVAAAVTVVFTLMMLGLARMAGATSEP
jgi:hypothetical protein